MNFLYHKAQGLCHDFQRSINISSQLTPVSSTSTTFEIFSDILHVSCSKFGSYTWREVYVCDFLTVGVKRILCIKISTKNYHATYGFAIVVNRSPRKIPTNKDTDRRASIHGWLFALYLELRLMNRPRALSTLPYCLDKFTTVVVYKIEKKVVDDGSNA